MLFFSSYKCQQRKKVNGKEENKEKHECHHTITSEIDMQTLYRLQVIQVTCIY